MNKENEDTAKCWIESCIKHTFLIIVCMDFDNRLLKYKFKVRYVILCIFDKEII